MYPGSFNPPTLGHLVILRAALRQFGLDGVDLAVSRVALGKEEQVMRPSLTERVDVLQASVAHMADVQVVVTDKQLLADIAEGYAVVIMGADKWAQVNDPVFYGGSAATRDEMVAALTSRELAIAPRPPHSVPPGAELHVPELRSARLAAVSSSGARLGRREWMTPEALAFDDATGAWSDPDRYDRLNSEPTTSEPRQEG